MIKLLIVWFIIGVIVGYLKIRQSRQFGFDRKIEFATLPYFVIGMGLWPLILFHIFRERKVHKQAYLRSLMSRSEFDKELDEIEREFEKMEEDTGDIGKFRRSIKCDVCGHEGKVEAHDTVDVVPKSQIFENLGKDSSTGFLHFRCPSCDEDLAVDPLKVIGAKQMVGYPASYTTPGKDQQTKRYVPLVWGGISLIAALFIFMKFSGWWTYIVGGVLLMVAWVSIKTGFFASEKEIRELTEPGPVSEETKRKFKDRL